MNPAPSLAFAALALGAAALPCRAQAQAYAFESGYEGWSADFADYPAGDSAAWRLRHSIGPMPGQAPAQNGLILAGDNFSDDLFLFVKRKVTGLVPGAEYRMTVSAGIVTSQCPDCIGGDDFELKAGATALEPVKAPVDGMMRMNIDKGNQARGGADMDTLGHVQHDAPGDTRPHLVRMGNASHPFRFKADGTGSIWVIIGVESMFETPVEWNLADLRLEFATPSAARRRMEGPRAPRMRPSAGWDVAGRRTR